MSTESKEMVLTGRGDDGNPGMALAINMSRAVSADEIGVIEARIRADAQVRATLAIARPRDLDTVRERLLKDAHRPGFADVAEYSVPRAGTKITGPSIRFVEAALSALGNNTVDTMIIREDDENRLCEVTVADNERNQVYRQAFMVKKYNERRQLPQNCKQEDIIGTRTNAEGQTLYLIKASEADVMMKQNAAASKVIRTLGLRLLPGDIKDEALDVCRETRQKQDAENPDAARRKLLDAFGKIGVSVAELKNFVGHDLATCSPVEIDGLRKIFAAIRDGEATWQDVVGVAAADAEKANDPAAKAAQSVKDKLAANKAGRTPAPSRVVVDAEPVEGNGSLV